MAQAAAAEYSPAMTTGLRAYAQTAQATLSPIRASILLHEGLCRELSAAKGAYQANQLDRMCRHLQKCQRVLLVLQNDIKFVPGESGPVVLSEFYLHLFNKVHKIQRNADVAGAFDEVIGLLQAFCDKMRLSSHT